MRGLVFAAATAAALSAAPQVNVTLYSESLCPDCIHFMTGAWYDVWTTAGVGYGSTVGDGAGIVAWNQVVWGNAKLAPDNTTITCQHGPSECTWNTLETCAIHHYPASAWLPFGHCLESKAAGSGITAAIAKKCAATVAMDWSTLDTCWTGEEGHGLDIDSAAATAALVPAHDFVPWVTLSDIPGTFCSNSNCDTFLSAVCAAYTGTQPSGCKTADQR